MWINAYKFASTGYYYGSISKNDKIRVYETWNGFVRVLYPIANGYKLAWIRKSDADNYLSTTKSSSNNSSNSSQNNTLTSPVSYNAKFTRKTSDNGWYGYHDINRNVTQIISSNRTKKVSGSTGTYILSRRHVKKEKL